MCLILFYRLVIINSLKTKVGEKKQILERLILVPDNNKKPFWCREFKHLNDLFKTFPNIDFWKNIKFEKKYESLSWFKAEYGFKILKKKYFEFLYKPSDYSYKKIELGEKVGKDFVKKRTKKTVKEFLNNE